MFYYYYYTGLIVLNIYNDKEVVYKVKRKKFFSFPKLDSKYVLESPVIDIQCFGDFSHFTFEM